MNRSNDLDLNIQSGDLSAYSHVLEVRRIQYVLYSKYNSWPLTKVNHSRYSQKRIAAYAVELIQRPRLNYEVL